MIKDTIDKSLSNFYTITAEINQFSVNYSGHAYLQLIEKEENSNKTIASMRAIIWRNKLNMIQAYFESITGSELTDGIKILAKVEVTFHQIYGMSLVIHDIDPSYTLGDIERRKQEIIDQLESDGILEMNKTVDFPIVPQRIAIISSKTAAGLDDFLQHLNNNDYHYLFKHKLFASVMQGDKTEESIIKALDNIFEEAKNFDAVVIIRGGGSKLDLSAFDSYEIAVNIAQFPLPILTGIGHQRDLSIADLVSHKSLKTPTAVADFLVTKLFEYENNINEKFKKIANYAKSKIDEENYLLESSYNHLKNKITAYIYDNKATLDFLKQNLKYKTHQFITSKQENLSQQKHKTKTLIVRALEQRNQELKTSKIELDNFTKTFIRNNKNLLEIIETKLSALDPQHILNLGYSITTINKKVVKKFEQVNSGDKIQTQLKSGTIHSIIQ